jgi:hypothetical protein
MSVHCPQILAFRVRYIAKKFYLLHTKQLERLEKSKLIYRITSVIRVNRHGDYKNARRFWSTQQF